MSLLSNIHVGLPWPASAHRVALICGSYCYYHYGCDGMDDRGWGCGYRTLQTICSWLVEAGMGGAVSRPVPSLREIQHALVAMGDKPPSFSGSREWIGTVEAALCMDHFYSVPGKLVHICHGRDLEKELESLYAHFQGGGGPIMVGGDRDHSAKALLGVSSGPKGHQLLVLDPHYYGTPGSLKRDELQNMGWVCWRELSFFEDSSFYNLCFPQAKAGGHLG
ncbi:inactive Ufm1-specific protease 1 [Eublepharis macularius]|uniref:Inactive Ufm1-specific protease 1 n=1 Tax=Eublepharis macularius TaxID=481883 RepID=A0AA97LDM7_EUBMA|nr:inactive Ufm1-specific protease 1 [Eublepharis macularius]XP_054851177.1 inactive Ufm1-specific protease 1 [Eublepharis macularius]